MIILNVLMHVQDIFAHILIPQNVVAGGAIDSYRRGEQPLCAADAVSNTIVYADPDAWLFRAALFRTWPRVSTCYAAL